MLGFHSVSVLSVALACYALTTVEQKPLRLGSDDTGCILHFTSEWHAIDEPKEVVNPQLLIFRVDCQNASSTLKKFREFKIWDESHICAVLTAHQYARDFFQGGIENGKFTLRSGDLIEFQCILLPLNFSASCAGFQPLMRMMFLDTSEEAEFVVTDWVIPDLRHGAWSRKNLADANEWLLDVQKSKGTERTVRFESPALENTSPFPSLPEDGQKLDNKVSSVDEDFLNPTILSVACDTCDSLPGINLTDSVRMVKSFFSIVDYGNTLEHTWYGIRFDIDVNASMLQSFPPGSHNLNVLMHFSFHRESRGLLGSGHEQALLVPVNVAHPDSPDHPDHPDNPNNPNTKQRRHFWFRMLIFFIVLLMVAFVTYRCCRPAPVAEGTRSERTRSQVQSEFEMRARHI